MFVLVSIFLASKVSFESILIKRTFLRIISNVLSKHIEKRKKIVSLKKCVFVVRDVYILRSQETSVRIEQNLLVFKLKISSSFETIAFHAPHRSIKKKILKINRILSK